MLDPLSHEWREEQDELALMESYAEMAKDHPTWSVAYARHVPKLLAKLKDDRSINAKLVAALEFIDGHGCDEDSKVADLALHGPKKLPSEPEKS